MGRKVVEHHANALGAGIMDTSEIAHADCEVLGGAPLGDLHLAPGAVHVQEHEQVRGAVAPVLAVVTLDLPRRGRNRLAHLADELDWALVEADHRELRIGTFGIAMPAPMPNGPFSDSRPGCGATPMSPRWSNGCGRVTWASRTSRSARV